MLESIELLEDVGTLTIAISEPFPPLSAEGLDSMKNETTHGAWHDCLLTIYLAACQLRWCCPKSYLESFFHVPTDSRLETWD